MSSYVVYIGLRVEIEGKVLDVCSDFRSSGSDRYGSAGKFYCSGNHKRQDGLK